MTWLGVRAGALNLLLPVGDIAEVLPLAACTAVPLTEAWFRGLCNVRGSLYSVLDLPVLLGFAPSPAGLEARILLLAPGRMRNTALLVNRLVGMQDRSGLLPCTVPPVSMPTAAPAVGALRGRWRDVQDSEWHELDVAILVRMPAFLAVAKPPTEAGVCR